MNFSAVILAGGKSSRMGRDKAFLEIYGQPLLARQIEIVRQAGASEIFISGRSDADYSAFGHHLLVDEIPNLGPLSGIASALRTSRHALILVLAVDMPHITDDFLKKLLAQCSPGVGAVPVSGQIIEPLAAFYPKSSARIVQELRAIAPEDKSPGGGDFAKQCVAAGLARFVPLSTDEVRLFKSLNTPADFLPLVNSIVNPL